MGGALVNAPAAGFGLDDLQAVAANRAGAVLPDRAFEPIALVDDPNNHPPVGESGASTIEPRPWTTALVTNSLGC